MISNDNQNIFQILKKCYNACQKELNFNISICNYEKF